MNIFVDIDGATHLMSFFQFYKRCSQKRKHTLERLAPPELPKEDIRIPLKGPRDRLMRGTKGGRSKLVPCR